MIAGLLAVAVASQHFDLVRYTVLVRGDCVGRSRHLTGELSFPHSAGRRSPSALSSFQFGRNPSSSCSPPGRCSRQKESTTCLVVRLRSNGTRSLRRSCKAWPRRRRLGAASGSRRTSLRLRRTRWSSASSPGARSRRRRARTPSLLSIGLRQAAWHAGCVTGSFPSPSRRTRFGLASLRSYARTGRERSSSFPLPCRIHGGILSSLTSARTRSSRTSASRLRLVSCPTPSSSAARSV